MSGPHSDRPHTPKRGAHGVECARCGMRSTWEGWKQPCAAPMQLDPDRHQRAKNIAAVMAWKARNPDKVRAHQIQHNANRRARYAAEKVA